MKKILFILLMLITALGVAQNNYSDKYLLVTDRSFYSEAEVKMDLFISYPPKIVFIDAIDRDSNGNYVKVQSGVNFKFLDGYIQISFEFRDPDPTILEVYQIYKLRNDNNVPFIVYSCNDGIQIIYCSVFREIQLLQDGETIIFAF